MIQLAISILALIEGFLKLLEKIGFSPKWIGEFIIKLLTRASGSFAENEFLHYSENYIDPFCQMTDPGYSTFANVANQEETFLLEKSIDEIVKESKEKYIMVLGDTGTGKTAFLINYYISKSKKIFKKYRYYLIRLNNKKLEEFISNISEKNKSIILFDALDEDIQAIKDYKNRLNKICELTEEFKNVILTCRTQFFPSKDDIPEYTPTMRTGVTEFNRPRVYTWQKRYIVLFKNVEIDKYIEHKFKGRKNKKKKDKASKMVKQYPDIFSRPMILEHIDNFIDKEDELKYSFSFYEIIIDGWLERDKFTFGTDDAKLIRKFLDKLSIELFRRREIHKAELLPFKDIKPLAQKFEIPVEDWKISGRSLLNRDVDDNFKFAHRSLLELLFVKNFLKSTDLDKPKVKNWTAQMGTFFLEYLQSFRDKGESIDLHLKKVDFEIISRINKVKKMEIISHSNKKLTYKEIKTYSTPKTKHFWIYWINLDQDLALDLSTELIWQIASEKVKGIQEVKKHIEQLNDSIYGGFPDWRLPNLDEAMSITNNGFEGQQYEILTSSVASPEASEELIGLSIDTPLTVKPDGSISIYRPNSDTHIRVVRTLHNR